MRPQSRAFTLVELLIVVAIIAILATIAVPNFLEAQARAKVSATRSDMRAIATAIEAYRVDYNFYPLNGQLVATGAVQDPQVKGPGAPAHKFPSFTLTTPISYLSSIPRDPFAEHTTLPFATWAPYYRYYFYTNLDYFRVLTLPSPPPAIAQKKELYGPWILAAAGPDGDRLDLARDLSYDPTNGTVSDGDIIVGQRGSR